MIASSTQLSFAESFDLGPTKVAFKSCGLTVVRYFSLLVAVCWLTDMTAARVSQNESGTQRSTAKEKDSRTNATKAIAEVVLLLLSCSVPIWLSVLLQTKANCSKESYSCADSKGLKVREIKDSWTS